MDYTKFLSPRNDIAFKNLFGTEKNKDIIVDFINDIMEYEGPGKIKTIQVLQTVQDPMVAAKKQSNVDILCQSNDGKKIIVEMQVDKQTSYKKRSQFYAARTYAGQLSRRETEKDEAYNRLMPVVFIAVTNYIEFPEKAEHISWHVLLDQKTHTHDLKEFSFTFMELPKFKKGLQELDSVLDRWCYFLKHAEETTEAEVASVVGKYPCIQRAYDELNKYTWTPAQLAAYEEEEIRIMDNLDAEDYQMTQGMEKGVARGRAEGLAEGEAKKERELILGMHEDALPLETIAKITRLSVERIEKVLSTKTTKAT